MARDQDGEPTTLIGRLQRIKRRFDKVRERIGFWMAFLGVVDKFCLHYGLPAYIFIVRAYPAGAFAGTPMPSSDRFTFRVATREELYRAGEEFPDSLPRAFIDESLANGDSCVGAFEGQRLVSFQWFSVSRTRTFKHMDMLVGPNQYHLHRAYTAPDCRGLRLHTLLFHFAALTLAQDRDIVAVGSAHNDATLMSALHRGSANSPASGKYIGMVGLVRLGRMVFALRSHRTARGCDELGVRFVYNPEPLPYPLV